MKVRKRRRRRRLCLLDDQVLLLVEEVVVDFDLAVGLEVVRQQHDRNRDLVQVVDLRKKGDLETAATLRWDQLQLRVQSGPPTPHRTRKERLSFRRTVNIWSSLATHVKMWTSRSKVRHFGTATQREPFCPLTQ